MAISLKTPDVATIPLTPSQTPTQHTHNLPYGPLRDEKLLLYSPVDSMSMLALLPHHMPFLFALMRNCHNQHLRPQEKERQTKGTQRFYRSRLCLITVPIPVLRPTHLYRGSHLAWEITRDVHPSSPGPGAIWEERNNDNPLVLDVSDFEIALDPASWTFYVALVTFEHSFGGELQPPAKMRGLDRV